ncbi:hypothetical protein BDZ89DRAFT_1111978 [Hymenopellis radicata]|nr:hypothetical protein BDZ89DRAFT_1111978 [Hymenopellis radicata]
MFFLYASRCRPRCSRQRVRDAFITAFSLGLRRTDFLCALSSTTWTTLLRLVFSIIAACRCLLDDEQAIGNLGRVGRCLRDASISHLTSRRWEHKADFLFRRRDDALAWTVSSSPLGTGDCPDCTPSFVDDTLANSSPRSTIVGACLQTVKPTASSYGSTTLRAPSLSLLLFGSTL